MGWRLARAVVLLLVGLSSPGEGFARSWFVGTEEHADFRTLHDACAACSPGDSILVLPGYYDEFGGEWGRIHVEENELTIRGVGADAEDARLRMGIDLEGAHQRLENLTFCDTPRPPLYITGWDAAIDNCVIRDNVSLEGYVSGGVVVNGHLGTATFVSCTFENNETTASDTGGGAIWGLGVTLRRCTFLNNSCAFGGGAVTLEQSIVQDCLFVGNTAPTGAAAYLLNNCEFAGCTLVANRVLEEGGGALAVAVMINDAVERCIFMGTQGGYGVDCRSTPSVYLCCDFWENEMGEFSGWGCGVHEEDGCFRADPLFCDPDQRDYRLRPGSPCLPGPHGPMECDLVGALGLGCDPSAVQETSWGRIKGMFR